MSTAQPWQFFNPVRVLAGSGVVRRVQEFVPSTPVLLLTSEGMVRRGAAQKLMQLCPQAQWVVRTIEPNPELDMLDALYAELYPVAVQMVVAFGGGSVMDAAKALSLALPTGQAAPLDAWLRGRKVLPNRHLPVLCLPTTAGTGAEVTPFATIWDGVARTKRSLGSDLLYPKLAVLDVELTLTLPWQETLFGALDTTSHALETLWNCHATPVSHGLAIEALQHVVSALPQIANDLENLGLRTQLQNASVLAGLAISQSKTALAHAVSYPLTVHYGVPHGLACSFTLVAMIDQVRAAGAFPVYLPSHLLNQVKVVLQALNLSQYLTAYCTAEEILALTEEMFDPTRADNFLLQVNEDFVEGILKTSLNYKNTTLS